MLETNEDTRLFQQVTAQFDAPAFVRRARTVDDARARLMTRCDAKRQELLQIPKLRLGVLLATAGDWDRVALLLLEPDDLGALRTLFTTSQPRLRLPVAQTESMRVLYAALQQLRESFERFNRKWTEFVLGIDLRDINKTRADYNKYYVLEKECSVRSAVIARQGFRSLNPLTAQDLFADFPLLNVPRLAS